MAVYISSESLLIIVLVGLVAGWLAGQIVQGTGLGLIGDMVIGVVGAFIGDWLMPRLGLHLGVGIIGAIINATIGAIVLLLLIRLVGGAGRGSRGSGNGWSRRWAAGRSYDAHRAGQWGGGQFQANRDDRRRHASTSSTNRSVTATPAVCLDGHAGCGMVTEHDA